MTDNRNSPSGKRFDALVDSVAEIRAFVSIPPEIVWLRSGTSYARFEHTGQVDDGVNYIVCGDYVFVKREILFLSVNQVANLAAPVALDSDLSTLVFTVALTGATAGRTYSALVGIRLAVNTTAANCGYIDLLAMLSIAADGAVTIAADNVETTNRLKAAIATFSATVAASGNGFAVSATRPAGVASRVSAVRAYVIQIDETVAA